MPVGSDNQASTRGCRQLKLSDGILIELRTLGSVQLDAPARPEARSVASQPKRLALLAYLAMAEPPGPKRRDTLLALFWPESEQEKGRQVLRQTVYLLRQSLGADAISSRTEEDLEIGPDVTCDARRFETLIASGHLREALDLYRGDFLDGFFTPGTAQEFDEWVAGVRRHLRGLASTAAWTLATEDERAGDATGALYWARRATGLDKDNETGVRDLMLLHRRLGDRVGALRVYEDHAARLKRELDAAPGAEVSRLADTLRVDAAAPPDAPPAPPAVSPAPAPAPTPALLRGIWAVAAFIVIAIAIGVSLLVSGERANLRRNTPPMLAVGPIVDVVSKDSAAESPVASDLLATSLTRLSGVPVIPAVRLYDVQSQLKASGKPATMLAAAEQAGASRMLRGTIHRDEASRLTLDAQILDLERGTVFAAIRTDGKDLFELVDRATDALAAKLGVSPPASSIADVTTRSVVAYRLYQEGLRAYYQSDSRTAQGLFRAAEAEDSTFAMAVYYDAIIAVNSSEPDGLTRLDLAARLAQHAPDRERLLIRYRVAAQHQSPAALAFAETLSVRYPVDLDALSAVAALRQRSGEWGAAAALYRDVIRRDSLSLRVHTARCLACEAYVDLCWTYIYADSMARAEAVIREWQARGGPGPNTRDLLSIALERQSRFAAARDLWRDAVPPGVSLRHAMIALRAGDYDSARATLSQLRSVTTVAETDWWLALILRNEGRPTEALALGALQPPMRAALLYEAGRYREALALSDRTAREIRAGDSLAWPRRLSWQLVHAATALAALHDTARLPAIADSVERLGSASFFGRDPRLHHYVRGLLWLARGDTLRAADAFRASIWSWTDGYTRANYELAKALLALGRPREAIYPMQAALRGDLQSSNLYLTRTEAHALLARAFEAAGMLDSARVHQAMTSAAWAKAETGLPALPLLIRRTAP